MAESYKRVGVPRSPYLHLWRLLLYSVADFWLNVQKVVLLVFAIGFFFSVGATGQIFDQITRPVAHITDPSLIALIVDELLIPAENISMMDVIDVTGNGYGVDDIVHIYPSLDVYYIGGSVSPAIAEIVGEWGLDADFAFAAATGVDEVSAAVEESQDPRALMGAEVVRTISRWYTGEKIDMRLSANADGLAMEMWNFDPLFLTIAPPLRAQCGGVQQRFSIAPAVTISTFGDHGSSHCVIATAMADGSVESRPCN